VPPREQEVELMAVVAQTMPAARPGMLQLLRWTVSDSIVMMERNLLVWLRVPAYIVFTVVQPVIFVLLFRYVFGGAIAVDVPGGYVSFLMPGIIAQTAAFATFATAIALAQEAKQGVVDRLRSLPMARSAYLIGRLGADAIRMFVTLVVIIGVGYAVGFRFQNGVGPAIAMVLLAEFFGVCIACISGYIGLAIKDEESVQAFGLIWLFPLTFVSSAFVPIESMPTWLQGFASNQPVTLVIDTMRYLALGSPLTPRWECLIWLFGILIVFVPLAVRAYRRA
jgi:ABC transporter DrrB family efflux protein